MRRALILVLLAAGCDSKPPAAPPPAPPPSAPVPLPASPPECPLGAPDLAALGFPKDVVAANFGSTATARKFQIRSDSHHVLLYIEVETFASDAEVEAAYKGLRGAREGSGSPVKDEDRAGVRGYFSPGTSVELVVLKGRTVARAQAAPPQGREATPEELEKLVRGASERLAR